MQTPYPGYAAPPREMTAAELPQKFRPLSAWAYFGYMLLFSIPLAGFICLIVFAFNQNNINRRNFARSYFIVFLIAVVIWVILMLTGSASMMFNWMGKSMYY